MFSRPAGSRWFRPYIALVLLNIFIIVAGVWLSRSVKENYVQSVQANQDWVRRLSNYVDLIQLAASVNAPGNDVFDTHAIDAETARRDRALLAFNQRLADARTDLLSAPQNAKTLPAWLDTTEGLMKRMVADSEEIFTHLRRGETSRAAAFMANMDRQYAQIAAAMTALSKQVGLLQTHAFEEQAQALRRMEVLELWSAGLLVIMVMSATVCGYRAVQRLHRSEAELERYSEEIAKARDAANAASKAKSDFLAVISHEIRTPLATVLGSADLLAVAEIPEKARSYVHAIQASGRHLLSIVTDVLDFSKIEASGVHLDKVDFELRSILEHVQWLMAPAATERHIDFDVVTMAQPDRVLCGDPTRLRQILLNLVSNAFKFTHQGSVLVKITEGPAKPDHVRLLVEVEDTGIGIPPERQAELFDPFCQATNATARLYGGTGLGLAICKRLVEAMHGTIGVESVPNQGSRFWFDIEFELGDPNGIEERVVSGPVWTNRLRILVVEDAELNRRLLAGVLEQQDHEVVCARNGAEALNLIQRQPFDVVVMDVQMPVLGGIEATRLIRRLAPPLASIPIVGLTANVLGETKQHCIEAGMNRCLPKPCSWSELFSVVSQVTGKPQGTALHENQRNAPSEAPLFDRFGLDLASSQAAENLLPQVIEDAAGVCLRLREARVSPEQVRQEAHRLKGTAGLFGLKRIRLAAVELQEAESPDELGRALDHLSDAVSATREELTGSGLIAARQERGAENSPDVASPLAIPHSPADSIKVYPS